MLASPPRHGDPNGGVHSWLFRISRHLHAHRTPDEIFDLLDACLFDCGRYVPAGEIRAAIDHSRVCAWNGQNSTQAVLRLKQWPDCDPRLRQQVIEETSRALVDLWEASSIRFDDNDEACRWVVQQLFPKEALICVGTKKNLPLTAPLGQLLSQLPAFQFIVPSPMTKTIGKNQGGEDSVRCLDSTGERRFLIVEFDEGSLDDQAALLWHLSLYGPLVLVVHSGAKSLHGWFACTGVEQQLVREFFHYACRLGADNHNWTRCQFVRMPSGTRDDGNRQSIYFFAPELLK